VYSVIVFQIVYCNTTTLTLLPKLRRTAASLLHPELVWLFTSICDLATLRELMEDTIGYWDLE
jgi:hypothetical protein